MRANERNRHISHDGEPESGRSLGAGNRHSAGCAAVDGESVPKAARSDRSCHDPFRAARRDDLCRLAGNCRLASRSAAAGVAGPRAPGPAFGRAIHPKIGSGHDYDAARARSRSRPLPDFRMPGLRKAHRRAGGFLRPRRYGAAWPLPGRCVLCAVPKRRCRPSGALGRQKQLPGNSAWG